MYGKFVEYAGFTVWVWCLPSNNEAELRQLAENKLMEAKQLGLNGSAFVLYLKGELQSLSA